SEREDAGHAGRQQRDPGPASGPPPVLSHRFLSAALGAFDSGRPGSVVGSQVGSQRRNTPPSVPSRFQRASERFAWLRSSSSPGRNPQPISSLVRSGFKRGCSAPSSSDAYQAAIGP